MSVNLFSFMLSLSVYTCRPKFKERLLIYVISEISLKNN